MLAKPKRSTTKTGRCAARSAATAPRCFATGEGVLTHCNAGGLATADYGTALAVFFAAHEQGKTLHVYADETRPLLQGARLTAWELQQRGHRRDADLRQHGRPGDAQGRVQAVVVGADRIAANGDTANKIGTYGVAVLAADHGIPFYVAAPPVTFDLRSQTGGEIPIEERTGDEVTPASGGTAPAGRASTTRPSTSRRRPYHRHHHRGRGAARALQRGARARLRGRRGLSNVSGARKAAEAPRPVKAMIMAAGLGTRLWPLTDLVPKPMVPILNRPVMEHIVRLLERHGVREVAANLHYYPDEIRGHFGDGEAFGLDMRFRYEEELLGTAGGVGNFRDLLGGDTFLVVSGDALTDVDLTAFLARHRASGGIATMAVKRVPDPSLYGVVVHDAAGRVTGFQEKPSREEARSDLCNCGIYAFEPRIFDFVPPATFIDWAKDVFPTLLETDEPFHVWELESYWNDVGNIEAYRQGNFDALYGQVDVARRGTQTEPGVWVGEGCLVSPGAQIMPPVLIGDRCVIEDGVSLVGPLIVGDGCTIEAGAALEGVIHWNGCKTGRNATAAGGIVGRGVHIHSGATIHEGAVIGERCVVESEAVVGPGARVPANTVVVAEKPGRL